MKLPECPTEADIRRALILRVEAFCRLTGTTPSAICRSALKGDNGFLKRIEDGGNFTLGSYQRVLDYIEDQLEVYAEKARSFLKAAER